jgi:tRNA nucleotidyltransferase (CCA-adding enzyme)
MKLNIPKIEFNYDCFIVGGFVRDQLLNVESKDIDLCIVAPFDEIKNEVKRLGGEVFIEKPEYLTVRCKLPELGDVDIAVARKDGEYSDGRRPDETFVANNIYDDLMRRDFTANAIAVDLKTGEVVDPFDGVADTYNKKLRCVGTASYRFREDYLRLCRAMRFSICKYFTLEDEIEFCLSDNVIMAGLKKVSTERIYDEMFKCFKFNTIATLNFLEDYPLMKEVFEEKLWLKPTMERK